MGRPSGLNRLTRAFLSWARSGWPFFDPGWPIGRPVRGRNTPTTLAGLSKNILNIISSLLPTMQLNAPLLLFFFIC